MPDAIQERIAAIVDSLTPRQRRLGDEDLSRVVLDQFCKGWSPEQKANVAAEIRTKARSVIRSRRAGQFISGGEGPVQ